ncbi:hypothetical protein WICMUC_002731 [Wickerhamomyces mucosus]|uniref:Transcription factor CBF/NF-Y/archaeal histone domain-containing protein n=1 Tax=Wickerhamomyces mucosus TaxID=1378264 RepID=A0A9P8PP17_9ASCO|nr:hypothetical protein WICMUC_002731 [Wickerhamomyces mucosus]
MKAALPPQAKLSKDSKMCMQECVSEFISFITSAAADKCFDENRKTLNGEDLLYALYTLGFENYAETLKIYLAKYRQNESLNAEERRRKDRLKRRLRKERKEVEFRETNERFGYQFQQDERHSSEESTGGLTAVKSAFRGYENDMKSDNDVINPNDINQS